MKNKKIILLLFISLFCNLLNSYKEECIECNIQGNLEVRKKIGKCIYNIIEIEDDFYKKFDIKNFNKKLDKIYENLIFIILNLEYFEIGYTNDYIKNIIILNNYKIFDQIIMNSYKNLHFYKSHHFLHKKINHQSRSERFLNNVHKNNFDNEKFNFEEDKIKGEYCTDIICKNLIMNMPIENYNYFVTNLLSINDVIFIERIIKLIPTINLNTLELLKDFIMIEDRRAELSNKYFESKDKKKIESKEFLNMVEYENNIYEPAKKEFDEKFEPLFIENFEKFKKELFERAKIFLNKDS